MVCDSPRLIDLAIALVNSVVNLPNGQVKFLEEFKLQKNCEISSAHQNVSWASWNDVWASICWLQLSQMASFKNDFLCSLKKNSCIYFSTFPYIHSFPCENRIGSQLVYYFFKTIYLILANLQVVGGKSVASGGKFYRLPHDKENTEIGAGAMRNCLPRRVAFLTTPNAPYGLFHLDQNVHPPIKYLVISYGRVPTDWTIIFPAKQNQHIKEVLTGALSILNIRWQNRAIVLKPEQEMAI